jgi:hypothetical protein
MATQENGKAKGKIKFSTEEDRRLYDTLEAAKAAGRPADFAGWKLFELRDAQGQVRYTWAPGRSDVMVRAARAAGYVANELGKAATPAKAAAMLAALSPEDRAALIAQYVPAPAPAQPSAPPKGKGK